MSSRRGRSLQYIISVCFLLLLLIVPAITLSDSTMAVPLIASLAFAEVTLDCNIDQGACLKKIGNTSIELNIIPKPVRVMEELTFTVTLRDRKAYDSLVLDLSMPGMFMGRNEVVLRKTDRGDYAGKGILTRCPSGRKLWKASIEIPGAGKADFLFHASD